MLLISYIDTVESTTTFRTCTYILHAGTSTVESRDYRRLARDSFLGPTPPEGKTLERDNDLIPLLIIFSVRMRYLYKHHRLMRYENYCLQVCYTTVHVPVLLGLITQLVSSTTSHLSGALRNPRKPLLVFMKYQFEK
jgi:hypothetical protein